MQQKEGKPRFCWLNTTHMHLRTHPKPSSIGQAGRWQSSTTITSPLRPRPSWRSSRKPSRNFLRARKPLGSRLIRR